MMRAERQKRPEAHRRQEAPPCQTRKKNNIIQHSINTKKQAVHI